MDVLQKGDIVYFFCSANKFFKAYREIWLRKILGSHYKDEKYRTCGFFVIKTLPVM